MKISIKRKEITLLYSEMKKLTGLPLRKALTFGKDLRAMQAYIDELSDFEKTKPARLVELQAAFDEKAKAAQQNGKLDERALLDDWSDGPEFVGLLNDYRTSEREFLNEEIEITLGTTFAETDLKLDKVSAQTGWMLSYFVE